MHKKKYINKSMYSIQGLKTVGNALPKNLNKILKKGGHNYSSIVNNWTEIVGKKTSQICYPKSIKTNKELQEGLLTLNVNHGNQLDVEYSKQDIIDKINSFFGYTFIKNIKIALIDEKIKIQHRFSKNLLKNNKLIKKVSEINNLNLRKKLDNLIKEFEQKNIK
tara:strand:+ start:69 stop:560 length:492 start_codon:yes stop_codon:yes gene_type:complete